MRMREIGWGEDLQFGPHDWLLETVRALRSGDGNHHEGSGYGGEPWEEYTGGLLGIKRGGI